ncbi:MAG: response regulator [Ruminiclostridium sp.]|nr:response regulator [Ruminiclostridium sp.]
MEYIADEYEDTFRRFVDLSTVRERLADKKSISEIFVDIDEGWFRAQFITVGGENGAAAEVIYTVQNIDSEKQERDRLAEDAKTLNFRISSIANIFMTVHELDVAANTFTEIKSQSRLVKDIVGDTTEDPQGMLRSVMQTVTDESCLDDVMRFIDLSTLEERLHRTDTIAVEYMNKQKLWRRGRFVASRRDERGRLVRVLWLSEDIDDEKRERDKLIDMSERALAASEAKSSFLSNMSHEIRTPINAVLGMNEMILRECEDSSILMYAENIRTSGNTLLGLINDILDFSKIEAGKMEIVVVDYDISSVINDLVNMIKTRAEDKGLTLVLDMDRKLPKLLRGDEVRIKQIITNILTNAVKYTEKGTVTFGMGFEKLPDDPDGIILDVYVKDTGIGIKKEDMDKLFGEFKRIDEERNRNIEGTGLGMSITKRLLEMMGSSLKAQSIYELGSKFSFRLKQGVVKWEELGDYEAAYKASLGRHERYKETFTAPEAQVLVVDDTPMNLTVFKNLLKKTKVKIDTADGGDDGLRMSYDKKYDIIFLDHMMPKKDGIQTLHELRSRPKDPNLKTPVVCLTANAISGAREQYLAEGFDDYLTKPIDPKRLEEMIIHYLPPEKVLQ